MTGSREWRWEATLRNGTPVAIRSLRPDDRERMANAVRHLDRESIYTRLFSYRDLTERGLDRIMTIDPERDAALVVTVGTGADETVIAGGRFVGTGGEGATRTAEIAFTVEEDYQGQGIAGRLLRHLVTVARTMGIATFEADVLAENPAMLAVFAKSGLPLNKRREDGTVHVTMSLAETTR